MRAKDTKCPAEYTLAMIGGRWKIPLIFHLLVYCPIIILTYIYDGSYLIRYENSVSHPVVPGRT